MQKIRLRKLVDNICYFCKHGSKNKVFKNGASKICGSQSLKILKWYGLPKAVFYKFSLVHS